MGFRTGGSIIFEIYDFDNLHLTSLIIILSLFLFSFNSGYLYQVVVRIPHRFARVIRPGSGRRLGRAYGARSFNAEQSSRFLNMARPRPCPRPSAARATAVGLSCLLGYALSMTEAASAEKAPDPFDDALFPADGLMIERRRMLLM
jgi:hypothetical protein